MASILGDFLLFVAVVWGIGLFGCIPTLLAERGRALFEGRPTRFGPVNYLLAAFAVGFAYALSSALVAGLTGGTDESVVLGWVVVLNAAYPALGATAVAVLAPRVGDWIPTGRGMHGHAVLAITAVWYWFVTTVGATWVIALLVFLEWMGTEPS